MSQLPKFVKYPEIPHLMEVPEIFDGSNVQVFEKLDGGNTQVRNLDGRVITGSRANFLTREEYFKFEWFKDFNNWAKSNPSFHNLPGNLIVYGEFTTPHILRYKPEFVNRFFLIDVYDTETKRFIPYVEAREKLENELDVKDVLFLRPLAEGKLTLEDVKYIAVTGSCYSFYGREGVVVKDYEKQKFAKLWRTSANPTKEGLTEEINKTILSLRGEFGPFPDSFSDYGKLVSEALSSKVYEELMRSGRKDISLSEIGGAIKRVTGKI